MMCTRLVGNLCYTHLKLFQLLQCLLLVTCLSTLHEGHAVHALFLQDIRVKISTVYLLNGCIQNSITFKTATTFFARKQKLGINK
jgi:hypothetical protein